MIFYDFSSHDRQGETLLLVSACAFGNVSTIQKWFSFLTGILTVALLTNRSLEWSSVTQYVTPTPGATYKFSAKFRLLNQDADKLWHEVSIMVKEEYSGEATQAIENYILKATGRFTHTHIRTAQKTLIIFREKSVFHTWSQSSCTTGRRMD